MSRDQPAHFHCVISLFITADFYKILKDTQNYTNWEADLPFRFQLKEIELNTDFERSSEMQIMYLGINTF